jgi:hypothetical protein
MRTRADRLQDKRGMQSFPMGGASRRTTGDFELEPSETEQHRQAIDAIAKNRNLHRKDQP